MYIFTIIDKRGHGFVRGLRSILDCDGRNESEKQFYLYYNLKKIIKEKKYFCVSAILSYILEASLYSFNLTQLH